MSDIQKPPAVLDAIVDKVLAFRPKPKSSAAIERDARSVRTAEHPQSGAKVSRKGKKSS